jgi:hypothetical protein
LAPVYRAVFDRREGVWSAARQRDVVGERRTDKQREALDPSARQCFMARPRISTEMRPSMPVQKR